MSMIKSIKLINRSNVLTKEEKKWLIKRGIVETLVNKYKLLLKFPFIIISVVFCFISSILEKISDFFYYYIGEPIDGVVRFIDNRLPTISLTKGIIRDLIVKEIKDNNTIKAQYINRQTNKE